MDCDARTFASCAMDGLDANCNFGIGRRSLGGVPNQIAKDLGKLAGESANSDAGRCFTNEAHVAHGCGPFKE